MKTNKTVWWYVFANILLIAGFWLAGIEIGSWRIGGVQWAWAGVLGYVLLVAAAVIVWVPIIRAEYRKRR